jgi:hypothetical protein
MARLPGEQSSKTIARKLKIPSSRKRPKIGDVIEIATRRGLYYALYTHKHPNFGGLIRVYRLNFSERPSGFFWIEEAVPWFSVFYLIGPSVSRGITPIVASVGIPLALQAFPLFRSGLPNPRTGKVLIDKWWLWDGNHEYPFAPLTEEQKLLPVLQIVDDTALIEMIESDYNPLEDL